MIHVGTILLWLAVLTGAAAVGLKAWHLWSNDSRAAAWFRRTMVANAAFLGAAFILLCLLFLVTDLTVQYVWTYTGTWIPWHYRLAGAWTGREGSLLLWTALTAGTVAWMARRRTDDAAPSRAWAEMWMSAILFAFLIAVIRQGTFAPTDSFLLAGRPAGNGFNPTLKSGYILIHPPLMFVAYALTIVPASAGLAHLITGKGDWSRIAARASRVNWVLYTFAMGLGGMWAYYTLGFGGYWAWDPVEVANLLPWLALTLYLHAQMMHGRRGWFQSAGPLLAVLPFLLTVFSTVSTRSGLWVSVHAFTDPTNTFNPDAAARLLGILDVDASLLPYFGILLGILLIALALWSRRLAIDHDALPRASQAIAAVLGAAGGLALLTPALFLSLVFEVGSLAGWPGLGALVLRAIAGLSAAAPVLVGSDDEGSSKKGWKRFVEVAPLAGVSVLLLSLLLVVSLMWHFAAVNGWSEAFWDARIPWLMTPVTLALIILMLRGRGKASAVQAAGAVLAAGIAAFTIGGTGYYAIVLAGGFLLAAVDKVKAVSFAGERPVRWGSFLLWVGAMANLAFWVDPPTSLLGGLIAVRWPMHVVMIPLSIASIIGAHLIGLGRPMKWPYVLTFLLGGYYVAPVFALAAWLLHRSNPVPVKPFQSKRARVVGVYGVHFALAVLMLGYASSTYFEADDSAEVVDLTTTFEVGGKSYQTLDVLANHAFDGSPPYGPVDGFSVGVAPLGGDVGQQTSAILTWESQTGSYRSLPAVLRLWDRDLYVTLDAVCIGDAVQDEGGTWVCTDNRWIRANELGGQAISVDDPQLAQITVRSLPGINGVWFGFALFVVYGLPMAFWQDAAWPHRPKRSKAAAAES